MASQISINITNNSNMKKRKFNDDDINNDNNNDNDNSNKRYNSNKRKNEYITENYNKSKKYTNKINYYQYGNKRIKKQNIWHKVEETWQDYLKTLNKIDTEDNWKGEKNCDWVYRIFKGKQELEYIEYVNKKFLIIPCEGKKMKDIILNSSNKFNLLVMPFDFTLRTIRDLRRTHIPLLYEMKSKALEVISKYISNIDETKLHCEFHYKPSTYHLHLHIGLGKDIEEEKNKRHIIYKFDDVINCLDTDTDYFLKSLKINVKNQSEWKIELEKYSGTINEKLTTNNEGWKFFENMKCYENL